MPRPCRGAGARARTAEYTILGELGAMEPLSLRLAREPAPERARSRCRDRFAAGHACVPPASASPARLLHLRGAACTAASPTHGLHLRACEGPAGTDDLAARDASLALSVARVILSHRRGRMEPARGEPACVPFPFPWPAAHRLCVRRRVAQARHFRRVGHRAHRHRLHRHASCAADGADGSA